MLDYEILRIIWWLLLGVLLVGFAVMDGFDLGVGMILHRVAKTNSERRVVINTIGPTWEGNQVWLILGGGAIFCGVASPLCVSFFRILLWTIIDFICPHSSSGWL